MEVHGSRLFFWVLWLEGNTRILEDRFEEVGGLWDMVIFLSLFWAFVTRCFVVSLCFYYLRLEGCVWLILSYFF